jgi:succinate dehydrogenase/fumarate reductase flavoprotein subunit
MEVLRQRLQKIIEKLQVEHKKKRIQEIETESTQPNFWQDHQTAGKKMKELSGLQKELDEIDFLQELILNSILSDKRINLAQLKSRILFRCSLKQSFNLLLKIHLSTVSG